MADKGGSESLWATDVVPGEAQGHCDLCGPQWLGRLYAEGKAYRILCCARCGLIWTDPLTYRQPARPTPRKVPYEVFQALHLANADSRKKRFRKQLRTFLSLRPPDTLDSAPQQVLEVGSGLGLFLDVCEELGMSAAGCDIDRRAVSYANRERERVRLGTLDGHYASESFDAVFAFNLIEHLTHPREFLEHAWRVLRPGGMLVLETPVQESLFQRLARAAYWVSRHRLDFFGMRPGGHRHKFSKKTFAFICEDMGFRKRYQRNISSVFGEIRGSTRLVCDDHKRLLGLALGPAWALATATGQGNRLFIVLRRPPRASNCP